MANFNHTAYDISPEGFKKVKSITINLYIRDCTGDIFFTDILVQGGRIATGWIGHVSEIKWTMDG